MNLISLIGIITVFLGATLALAQKDIKRGLAYSTMSQLGYIMLALGMGSYRTALFHLITHAYSKALLFLGSGSVIYSMETLVGYSPYKNQNIILMGGLTKHVPITKTAFLLGTLSLCGIPPLACFWSKDEILNDSWLYSPIFAIIAWSTAGLTAFYMFRIYLLTFEGHLNVQFQNYSGKKSTPFYSISPWGKQCLKTINKPVLVGTLLTMNSNKNASLYSTKAYRNENVKMMTQPFITMTHFANKKTYSYPYESDNIMLFSLLLLILFTFFVGALGIPFNQAGMCLDILSKWLTPSINLLHPNSKNYTDWSEFGQYAIFSVSIAYFGIFIALFFYKPVYSSFQNLELINFFGKLGSKRIFGDKIRNVIYDWSNNRGYIDAFYTRSLTVGIRRLAEATNFFDRRIIDGITNGVGVMSFFLGEGIKYLGGGRISSYLFFYLSYVSIFLLILYFFYILF
jgi:NAD(P)H-quinone oxidoreductase subunit 5